MNTKQIDDVMHSLIRRLDCHYLGVFSADTIPYTIDKHPACLISNTDPSSKPGAHWVAIFYADPSKVEFFDSYSLSPNDYSIHHFDKTHKLLLINNVAVQSLDSSVCGQHCIFYLYHRALGHSNASVVGHYTHNLDFNDKLVTHFVRMFTKNSIRTMHPYHPHDHNKSQICTKRCDTSY